MKTPMQKFCAAALVAAALTAGAVSVNAQTVVYSDTLTNGTGATLNGVQVQTSSGFAGGTNNADWITASGVTEGTNGASVPVTVGAGGNSSFLPFTPLAGFIYNLSLNVTFGAGNTTDNGSWFALGFTGGDVTTGSFHTANTVYSWALDRPPGSANQNIFFYGPGTGGGSQNVGSVGANSGEISIVLNTMGSNWSSSVSFNGTNSTTNTYSGSIPGISYLGFGSAGAGNSVSPFIVNDVVLTATPEPGTVTLAAVGGLALVLAYRRRRSA